MTFCLCLQEDKDAEQYLEGVQGMRAVAGQPGLVEVEGGEAGESCQVGRRAVGDAKVLGQRQEGQRPQVAQMLHANIRYQTAAQL